MPKAVISYEKDLTEIPDRRPWEKPALVPLIPGPIADLKLKADRRRLINEKPTFHQGSRSGSFLRFSPPQRPLFSLDNVT